MFRKTTILLLGLSIFSPFSFSQEYPERQNNPPLPEAYEPANSNEDPEFKSLLKKKYPQVEFISLNAENLDFIAAEDIDSAADELYYEKPMLDFVYNLREHVNIPSTEDKNIVVHFTDGHLLLRPSKPEIKSDFYLTNSINWSWVAGPGGLLGPLIGTIIDAATEDSVVQSIAVSYVYKDKFPEHPSIFGTGKYDEEYNATWYNYCLLAIAWSNGINETSLFAKSASNKYQDLDYDW